MDPSLPVFRHSVTDCNCAHSSHIGQGFEALTSATCPECDEIERKSGAVMTIVTVERAAEMNLTSGSQVRYDGRTMSVVNLEPVTKLWGRIATGYVRVMMKDAA